MKYLFRPDELKRGISPEESRLDFLSCQRIELDGDNPAATVETGLEEKATLMRIGAPSDRDTDLAHIRFSMDPHSAVEKTYAVLSKMFEG